MIAPDAGGDDAAPSEEISEPAKIIRIGSMVKTLLGELRETELDEPSRERMRHIYETSIAELGESLSPDLCRELDRLAADFADDDEPPTATELRIAQAQLVGWLEGLFQGIQATLMAQQAAAQQQLQNVMGQLPKGSARPHPTAGQHPTAGRIPGALASAGDEADSRPGTYL